jgi:hypothetical protein
MTKFETLTNRELTQILYDLIKDLTNWPKPPGYNDFLNHLLDKFSFDEETEKVCTCVLTRSTSVNGGIGINSETCKVHGNL